MVPRLFVACIGGSNVWCWKLVLGSICRTGCQHAAGKRGDGKLLGYKTLITPSKTKLKAHTQKIGKLIDGHKSIPQSDLIAHLNPVIRGWTNYYSGVVSFPHI
ncbi:group II intron maturase-specific domain-containing protein [Cylindrospermum stagnale]|uniref:group II intron maturase-specific domain-containing protein n=1 Tax=Cylindrospermum stagnale TaxID=142864 RepID=UPI002480D08C|nr:group II intron maturase-specific domain-containing protein [Cylindrospermum stagnale]